MISMFDIFQYDFMVRALIAGTIIGIIAPLVGMFLVVRRYSYLADTLAHVSLVGVAAALVGSVNPVFGAMAAAIISAVGMEQLRIRKGILSDSLLAIFLSGSLALAVVLIGSRGLPAANLFSYMFGTITTVNSFDLPAMGCVGTIVLLFIIIFKRSLFLVAFDEDLAAAEGARATLYNTIMVILAALVVSFAIRIVGALLIGALIVIPVTSAIQWKKNFRSTMVLGVLFSLLAVHVGLWSSFSFNLPSGATIVLTSLLIFIISLIGTHSWFHRPLK